MSILDQYEGSAATSAPLYVAPPRSEPARKFSAWSFGTAAPRGVMEAVGQGLASIAEIGAGFGEVMGAYPELMGVDPTAQQRKEADDARTRLLRDGMTMQSDFGDSLRLRGAEMRPDARTAHAAESLVYGFARGATKIVTGAAVGGAPGVIAAGAEEGFSQAEDLKQQGVGFKARTAAGAVQGAGLALAALPAVGTTLKSTAALYLAGGPGGFIAQQALTREILRNAGHDQIAEQYDPFDPVGLAVASIIPAVFAGLGVRAQRRAAAAKSAEATPSVAADTMPREAVDAAMVQHQVERRSASSLAPDTARPAEQHETALARAEDQIARGEPVRITDVAPMEPAAPPVLDWTPALAAAQKDGLRVEWMSPQRYLDLSPEMNANPGKIARLQDAAQAGEPLRELPSLTVEANADGTGGVIAQEGRHRATVYRDAGVQQMPVVLAQAGESVTMSSFRGQDRDTVYTLRKDAGQLADAVEQLRRTKNPEPPRAAKAPEAPNPEGSAAPRGPAEPAAAPAVPEPRGTGDAQAAGMTPAIKAEDAAVIQRLADAQAQHPDLMVQIDGMDKPMRLADFLAAVKAEADEMKADAPLMEIAASCAIVNG